jgi:hypothetical protein
MKAEAAQWIKESRTNLESVKAKFARMNSMTPQSCRDFLLAHELAIKAVVIEKGGALPNADKLTRICELIGLWNVVPPKLRNYISEVDVCGSEALNTGKIGHQDPGSSSVEQWKNRLEVAPKFVFFIENQVIGNPSLLKGISVP